MIEVLVPQYDYATKMRNHHHWFVNGLRKIARVKEKRYLTDECFDRGIALMPFVIDGQKMFYDWSDWRRRTRGSIERVMEVLGDAKYFKNQFFECHMGIEDVFEIPTPPKGIEYLEHVDSLRGGKFKNDVVGIFTISGYKQRLEMVERVRAMGVKQETGLLEFPFTRPPGKYPIPPKLKREKMPYLKHLELQATSKICLSAEGVGPKCFREAEIMGMGRFLLIPETPGLVRNPYPLKSWGECRADLSDLEEKIDYWLTHDAQREQVARNGMRYYEDVIKPESFARNIVEKCVR